MKILIISQYFYPEQFQINEIAPELVKRGHKVSVICGYPNYPHGRIFNGYETREKRRIKEAEYYSQTGVKVFHCRQTMRRKNPLSRILNYFSFPLYASRLVKKLDTKYDIVLCYHVSPIMMLYPAVVYKEIYKVPMVTYNLDIWPECAQAFTKNSKGVIYNLITKMSSYLYRKNDLILVTSRPFIDYLVRVCHVDREKLKYLPQHANSEMMDMDLSTNSKQRHVANFLFAGNFGAAQRLDVIVDAAATLGARKDYVIHMVGDGSMRSSLEQMVKDKGLESNFIFHGNQTRADMPTFYKKADVLLITLRGNNEVGNTMPGKLQVYMTTGKPILGAINGAANEIIKESKCGLCVNSGDYIGLADLIRMYIEKPQDFALYGENARKYFSKNFTLDIFMNGLENELNKLIRH